MTKPKLQPLGPRTLHLCIDMQRLFAEKTVWHTAALPSMIDPIRRLTLLHPGRTVFTRFVTPRTAADAPGTWRRYYGHWSSVLLERMPVDMIDLVPELADLVPPEREIDKLTHSAFTSEPFLEILRRDRTDALVVTGVETDVCVLTTVLDAVDRGIHVVVVTDGVASSVPDAHRATIEHVYPRYDQHLELMTTNEVIAAWR
jgi:nicotinamidase-related amidase